MKGPLEEAFHEQLDFFREHAWNLASGLVRAVEEAASTD